MKRRVISIFLLYLLACIASFNMLWGGEVSGRLSVLVIPVSYSDESLTYGRDDFEVLFNGTKDNEGESVREYYLGQFASDLSLEFIVTDPVTLSHVKSYYGANTDIRKDVRAEDAVVEACFLVDDRVNFSEIDVVILVGAGGDEAQGNGSGCIWSHHSSLEEYGVILDGSHLRDYIFLSELYGNASMGLSFARIGFACHEIGHYFGLVDLCDDLNENDDERLKISLMGSGLYNNQGQTPPVFSALEWEQLGLGRKEEIHAGHYELMPAGNGDRHYLYQSGPSQGEYLLYEFRKAVGQDSYIGKDGLAVYYLDLSRDGGEGVNASILSFGESTDRGELFFKDGTSPDIELTDIEITDGVLSFNAVIPIHLTYGEAFQDAIVLGWECIDDDCKVSWFDGEKFGMDVVSAYAPGHFSYTIEGLPPGSEVIVTISSDVHANRSVNSSFKTKKRVRESFPYIYLGHASRNEGGALKKGEKIPLVVFNLDSSATVEWFFDDSLVSLNGDGLFELRSGVLEARVHFSDGRTEKLRKKLVVK